MILYNTLTKKKEELVSKSPIIYVCGPTVYDFIHVGNARALVVFDILRRFLSFQDFNVKYIQNFTDVDDKIIIRAKEEGVTPLELSSKYIDEYFKDADSLGIKRADIHPRVSENMPEIMELVNVLLQKGFAYETNDGIYYETSKFKGYGKLSHKNIDDLLENVRGKNNSENKKNPEDFAIWKYQKTDGEISWEWKNIRKGRPGWHIECSAMSYKYSGGKTLAVHGGGCDLIFPHHENEIAQSESAYEIPLADIWVHNEMLLYEGRKISKSEMSSQTPEAIKIRELFQLRSASKKFGYEPIRLVILLTSYGVSLNYSEDALKQAAEQVKKFHETAELLEKSMIQASKNVLSEEVKTITSRLKTKFDNALHDNLNTALAISYFYELRREINSRLLNKTNKELPSFEDVQELLQTFKYFSEVTGLVYDVFEAEYKKINLNYDIPEDIKALVEKRKIARIEKNFSLADEIRNKITNLGYALKETKTEIIITKL